MLTWAKYVMSSAFAGVVSARCDFLREAVFFCFFASTDAHRLCCAFAWFLFEDVGCCIKDCGIPIRILLIRQ